MRLFDETQRTDSSLGKRTETLFRALNRVARPEFDAVRSLLESWFERFPDAGKKQLRGDFRATEPRQSLGAFWELYVHEIHRRLGYELERDPELADTRRRPDFLARRGDSAFYLEATVITISNDEMAAQTRWNVILDLIDEAFDPDFSVSVRVKVGGQDTPSRHDVIPHVEAWLASLEWTDAPPVIQRDETELRVRDWVLKLRAHPKPPSARGDPLLFPTIFSNGVLDSRVDERQYLEDNLRDKSKYGKPALPFVVAALCTRNLVTDRLIQWALYGPEVLTVPVLGGVGQINAASLTRNPYGLWQRGAEPQVTRVSAVLTARHLGPLVIPSADLTLWKNPWAARPLTEQRLPWRTITGDLEQNSLEVTEPTVLPRELLELDADWPAQV
jgi:hypothetical protein